MLYAQLKVLSARDFPQQLPSRSPTDSLTAGRIWKGATGKIKIDIILFQILRGAERSPNGWYFCIQYSCRSFPIKYKIVFHPRTGELLGENYNFLLRRLRRLVHIYLSLNGWGSLGRPTWTTSCTLEVRHWLFRQQIGVVLLKLTSVKIGHTVKPLLKSTVSFSKLRVLMRAPRFFTIVKSARVT